MNIKQYMLKNLTLVHQGDPMQLSPATLKNLVGLGLVKLDKVFGRYMLTDAGMQVLIAARSNHE